MKVKELIDTLRNYSMDSDIKVLIEVNKNNNILGYGYQIEEIKEVAGILCISTKIADVYN